MSPEFFTTIGVGVSIASFLAVLMLYLANQTNRRIDRLEDRLDRRMDGLEGKVNNLQSQINSIDMRLSKLEWIVRADYGQRTESLDVDTD